MANQEYKKIPTNNNYQEIPIDTSDIQLKINPVEKYLQDLLETSIKARTELKNHATMAHMNQVVVSTPENYIVGTEALATCTGILFYNKALKKGICGHAGPNSGMQITMEMLKHIDPNEDPNWEYTIVSGYDAAKKSSDKDYEDIKKTLALVQKVYPHIKFKPISQSIRPHLDSKLFCYNFAFDVLHELDVSYQMFDKEAEAKIKI